MLSRRALLLPAAAACSVITVAAPVIAQASGTAPQAASWKISKKVTGPNFPTFTAATVTSATSAWAFFEQGTATPSAWQFNGSTWSTQTFPDVASDDVLGASSSSASNSWAVTFKGNVLQYNGIKWTKIKHFGKSLDWVVTTSSTNVWVFSGSTTWHLSGSTWTTSASGSGLYGASALSASNIWAASQTGVAHWNGSSWRKTSLKSLLPKNTTLSRSFVGSVYAASAKSVYAFASGGRQDEGGPLVLLHYNGSKWSKLGEVKSLGNPLQGFGDGSGGVWIPVNTGFPGSSSMEHYTHGSLHNVALPYSPHHLLLFGASAAKNGAGAVVTGFNRKSFSSSTVTAVILRLS